jgi:tetratricopeptide (TPR) repeat protein
LDWQWRPTPEAYGKLLELARRAAAQAPDRPRTWLNLANLLSDVGRDGEAAAALGEGVAHCPGDADLRLRSARALRAVGDYEGALEQCERALDLSPARDAARLLRFVLLAKTSRWEAAERHVDEAAAIAPCEPYLFECLGARLDRPGAPETLIARCDAALALDPACANATYFKALALTKLGRADEARALLSVERDVEISEPGVPPGFASRGAFLAALAEEIRRHPTLAADPRGKSTERGRQTGLLQDGDGPAIAAAIRLIREAVAQVGRTADGPPTPWASARPAQARLNAWAVVCGPEGRQQSHRHPDGWLSGVFYVAAPAAAPGGGFAGPLLLGALDEGEPEPPWSVRRIEPVPGRLVTFPSATPHATAPSCAAGERICVAFDVVPAA